MRILICWIFIFLHHMLAAVVRTTTDSRVMTFTFTFIIVVCSFALGFYIALGNFMSDHRSYDRALLTVIRYVFGEFTVDSDNFQARKFESVNFFLGPLFFVLLLLFLSLVMLNVFIALINDVYTENLRLSEQRWQRQLMELQYL
jgi:polycystin 2